MERVNFFGLQFKQAEIPSLSADVGMALSDEYSDKTEGGGILSLPIHPYYAYLA